MYTKWGSVQDVNLTFENGLHVRNVDIELFKLMKMAGCSSVWFGIESGNPVILKKLMKGINLEMVRNAVKLAKKAKIPVIGGHFIIGLPDETIDTARDTIAFAKELKLDVISFNHANILPGSKLWDWVMEHGRLLYPMDEMGFINYRQSGIPIFETPEFTAEERRMVYSEAIAFEDSIWRRKALSMGSIMRLALKLRSAEDVIWALKKFNFFLSGKDFAIKGFPNQPSLSKKH